MRTPPTTAAKNTVSSHSIWNVNADGSADLNISIQTTGYAATEMQDKLEQIAGRHDWCRNSTDY